jgi:hypothetical protein
VVDSFDDFMERERQRARRRLGIKVGEHCAFPNCDEADPLELTGSSKDLLCYEHRALQQNRPLAEGHHPATKRVEPGFTVQTLGNDHRAVTVMSRRWAGDLKDMKSSALRKSFARLAGLRDVERQLIDKYQDTTDLVGEFMAWVDQMHPEWEEEFNRSLASRERREP